MPCPDLGGRLPSPLRILLGRTYLFDYCEIAQLSSLCTCYLVKFAQCAFGLEFPDSKPNEFCRKNTYVLSNMKELRELSRKCPGISRRHMQARACLGISKGQGEGSESSYTRSPLQDFRLFGPRLWKILALIV